MREDAGQRRSERVSRSFGEVSASERQRRHGARESRTENRLSACSPSSRLQTRSNSSDGEPTATPLRERLSLRKRRPLPSPKVNAEVAGEECNGHITPLPPDLTLANGDCDSDEITFSPRVHRSHARFPRTSTSNRRSSSTDHVRGVSDSERVSTTETETREKAEATERETRLPVREEKEESLTSEDRKGRSEKDSEPKKAVESEKESEEEENDERTFSPRVHRSRNRFPRTTPTLNSKGSSSQRLTLSPPELSLDLSDAKEEAEEELEVKTMADEEKTNISAIASSALVNLDLETSDEEPDMPKLRRRSGRLVTRIADGNKKAERTSSKFPAGHPKPPAAQPTPPPPLPTDDTGSDGPAESSSDSEESIRPMVLRQSVRRSRTESRTESRTDSRTDSRTESQVESQAESRVESRAESQAESKSQSGSEEEEEGIDFSRWVSPRRSTRIVMQRSRVETGPPPELARDAEPERPQTDGGAEVEEAEAEEEKAEVQEEEEEPPPEPPRLRKRRRSSPAESRDLETSSSASTVAAVTEPPAKRRRRRLKAEKPEAISEDDEEAEEEEEEEGEEEAASEVSSAPASNQQTPTRPKKQNRPKKKEDDENATEYYEFQRLYYHSLLRRDPVCLECEKMGAPEEVLTCTDGCQMAFHRSCADKRLNRLIATGAQQEGGEEKDARRTSGPVLDWSVESFKCPQCLLDRRCCFICKEEQGSDSAPLVRCHVASCSYPYHEACLRAMTFTKVENRRLTCPVHLCHACANDNPASRSVRLGRMVRCIRCPVAYHANDFCIAAGSLELSGNFIVCPNHFEASLMKRWKTVNTLWCLICSKGGTLICCEKCPASFHTDCIDVDGESMPDKFVCDDCLQGRNPRYGEIVWAKVGHFRWWPCEVVHSRNAPKNILKLTHYSGQFVVHFFGSDEYCWIHRGRVFSFEDGDYEELKSSDEDSNNRLKRWYAKGIKVAVRAFNAWTEDREEKESKQDSKKPYPYRYIRSNYPIGNVKVHRPGELHELPRCDCDPNKKTSGGGPCSSDSECLNRMLMYECHPSICRAGDKCENQRFVKREYPEQEIFRTTDNRGWGLLAGEAIKKGEFVNEYIGDLIDEEEAMKRLQQAHENNVTNYYMLTLDRTRIIDAGPKGNLSRFMNHSCNPSLETQKWLVNGDFRIGLFAARDLKKGEELTFNYNFQSLGDEQCVCRCGADSCKGFLGNQTPAQVEKQQLEEPQKQKNQSKEKQSQQSKQKTKSKVQQQGQQNENKVKTKQQQSSQAKSKTPQQSSQNKKKTQQQQVSQTKSKTQQSPAEESQSKKNQNKKAQPKQLKSLPTPQKVLNHKLKVKHKVMQKKQKQQAAAKVKQQSKKKSQLSRHDSYSSLQSCCSSSDADNSGPADTPSSSKGTSHKQAGKNQRINVLTMDKLCFRCGEEGETMCCDAERCPKAYHLACLGIDKTPNGKWFCPWHHCDFCGRAASILCRDCTTSYCELHAASDAVAPLVRLKESGLVLCPDHSPDPEMTPSEDSSGCQVVAKLSAVCPTSESSSTVGSCEKYSANDDPTKNPDESIAVGDSSEKNESPEQKGECDVACVNTETEIGVTEQDSPPVDVTADKESSADDGASEAAEAAGPSATKLPDSDPMEMDSSACEVTVMETSACDASEPKTSLVDDFTDVKDSNHGDKGKENTTPPRQSASATQSALT